MTGDTETTTFLSVENRTELSNIIWEYILGEEPAAEFIDALLEKNPLLIAEGDSGTLLFGKASCLVVLNC